MPPRRFRRLPARRLERSVTVYEATTFSSRVLGLALLRRLPPGHALLIPGCRSVHTFGMRFRIDVVAVGPRRLLRCRGAYAVLETRAGEAAAFSRLRPPAARGGS
jgi:hypothetical protein